MHGSLGLWLSYPTLHRPKVSSGSEQACTADRTPGTMFARASDIADCDIGTSPAFARLSESLSTKRCTQFVPINYRPHCSETFVEVHCVVEIRCPGCGYHFTVLSENNRAPNTPLTITTAHRHS
jgi:hypothetical protein